jgi:hypothetical protein
MREKILDFKSLMQQPTSYDPDLELKRMSVLAKRRVLAERSLRRNGAKSISEVRQRLLQIRAADYVFPILVKRAYQLGNGQKAKLILEWLDNRIQDIRESAGVSSFELKAVTIIGPSKTPQNIENIRNTEFDLERKTVTIVHEPTPGKLSRCTYRYDKTEIKFHNNKP